MSGHCLPCSLLQHDCVDSVTFHPVQMYLLLKPKLALWLENYCNILIIDLLKYCYVETILYTYLKALLPVLFIYHATVTNLHGCV
jgi:hypothetical protein